MGIIFQSVPFNKSFILVSSTDHTSPITGAQPVALISKNGQPFVTPQGAISEIGDGWYVLAYTAIDTSILGDLALHVTAIGADDTDQTDQIVANLNIALVPGINPNTLNNFIIWIQTIMGVGPLILPITSPYIVTAYTIANEIVNEYIGIVSPSLYTQAVYNLGGDILVNITQDIPPSTYWKDLRASMKINNFVPGVVNNALDEDTSTSILTPAAFENLTIGDLQNLKSPWGRQYLNIAQSVGTLWGIS
jgi:hypothetical protein